MKSLLTSLVQNRVLANLLLIMTILAGTLAAFSMIKEEMPNVTFDIIVVSVVYPGASPEEVEEGISRKVEEAVRGMEGIKSYTTIAKENNGVSLIEIRDGYNGLEMLDRVRTKINEISTFPSAAEKPIITLPLHSDPVMAIYLSGSMSEKALKEWAMTVKDELLRQEEISQVQLTGIRDYEINVEVSEQKLREYGIAFSQVAEAIRSNNLGQSGGLIKGKNEEIRVRTLGKKYTDRELASIGVIADSQGGLITLGELASIRDGFSDDTVKSSVNGQPAILINIYKTSREDAIHISDAVHSLIDRQKPALPPGADLGILFDNSDSIRHQIGILLKNGIMGLVTVFLILGLFLNARLSLWTGMGIAVSVFGGLVITWLTGGTINMVSIFGFIMILGIVADDAIVAGESIIWHRSRGAGPVESSVNGLLEVAKPVTAAVMTTILAFLPLLFIGGLMGKFIRILPIVVIACLAVSLAECFIMLPAHLSHLPPEKQAHEKHQPQTGFLAVIPHFFSHCLEWFSRSVYMPALKTVLRKRYAFLSLTIAMLLVTLGLIQGGFVKFEMLPQRDGFYITSIVRFPEGTSLETTEKAVRKIEKAMQTLASKTTTESGDPLVVGLLAMSGQSPGVEPGNVDEIGTHIGGVQVMLLEAAKRGISTKELAQAWQKETGSIVGAQSVSYTGTIMGPPGKPIEIGIDGHDLAQLARAKSDLIAKMKRIEGVYDVQSDLIPGKNEIRFDLKPEARSLGLTVQDLSDQLYTGYFGQEVLQIQRGRDNIKIRVRYPEEERQRLSSLEKVRIRSPQGYEIPLHQIADVSYGPGSSAITRTDGYRRITVSADVDNAIIHASEVLSDLEAGYFRELESNYPGIRLSLGGEAGETEESFGSMLIGYVLVLFAMYLMVATLFRSYLQPLIILITIPFGIIGAIWGHFLLGQDLTMISMFGMIGLTGIVLNDAIVLIEKINRNLAQGMPFAKAVLMGGQRRFRAVFLTSISTIGGLIPLILETDAYAFTLKPMAITLVAGVAFTTILTLLLIPSLLAVLNDLRLLSARLLTGSWKERADVEPNCMEQDLIYAEDVLLIETTKQLQ